jgi:Resolvase, N terminal domain
VEVEDGGIAGVYACLDERAEQARPGLAACLKALHPGDTLVVWKLDRVARLLLHLLEMMQDLQDRPVGLRILEGLNTQKSPVLLLGLSETHTMGSSEVAMRPPSLERGCLLVGPHDIGHVMCRRPLECHEIAQP